MVGVDGVYAAGDTAAAVAEGGHVVMQSCQHAVPRGKIAGANVATDVLGLPPNPVSLSLGKAGVRALVDLLDGPVAREVRHG